MNYDATKLREFIRAHGIHEVAKTAFASARVVRRWSGGFGRPNMTEWARLESAYGPGPPGEARAKRKARAKKATETRAQRRQGALGASRALSASKIRVMVELYGAEEVARVAGAKPEVARRWGHNKGSHPTPAQAARILASPWVNSEGFTPTELRAGRNVVGSAGAPTAVLASGHTLNTETGEMLSASQTAIAATCDAVKALLLEKNAKYGDSALRPRRIFSKATAVEQILVRVDDKISRIETTGFSAADEDTLQDLIGYCILLKIALERKEGA